MNQQSYWIPNTFFPCQEAFAQVGFKVHDMASEEMAYMTLPIGWKCKRYDGCSFVQIVDEKDRPRGQIVRKWNSEEKHGFLQLNPRYKISTEVAEDGKHVMLNLVVKDYDDAVIYTAGDLEDYLSNCDALEQKARAYMDRRYPGWENPNNYWD